MKTINVICDTCGRQLNETGQSGETRVVVQAESIPNNSGMSTLMVVYPWPPEPLHFCGKHCLKEWVTR